jgi:hypothetical protein
MLVKPLNLEAIAQARAIVRQIRQHEAEFRARHRSRVETPAPRVLGRICHKPRLSPAQSYPRELLELFKGKF